MRNVVLLPTVRVAALAAIVCSLSPGVAVPVCAQSAPASPATANQKSASPTVGPAVQVAADYVIGADDVIGIVFWRDTDMSGDHTVRPDGKITLPLIGDVAAAGLTPEALKEQITKAAVKLIEDPTVTVVVRTINSRKVYITGQVTTPNGYPLTRDLTVMQLISLAGGLTEYADKKNITVLRTESGQQRAFKVNYKELSEGKNLAQNIVLKPGDQVLVR